MHVGRLCLLRAPAGGAERPCELVGELANLDGELAALLRGVLVGAERAMDLPAELLQSLEHRAVGGGRGVFAHISDDDVEDWRGSIDIVLRRFADTTISRGRSEVAR